MKTICFADYGQDFLEVDIDGTGVVLDVRPFQQSVLRGVRVTNHQTLERGAHASVLIQHFGQLVERHLVYPVEAVIQHSTH